MNVAVLGSGAREHALAERLGVELGAEAVSVTPGGACIPGSFPCQDADLIEALRARQVELVVIGPEALLARGLAGTLRGAGFLVVGPDEEQAQLETSKAYAKDFMARHRVACARSETVRGVSVARSLATAQLARGGVVLKYDGLAAGKGVFVCDAAESLEAALGQIETSFGAGAEIVIEERLRGRELSLIVLVAGGRARAFPPVEDHKQLLDDDRGPMTGGMGVFRPIPHDTPELRARLWRSIVEPTLAGLRADHPDYRGVLFFGVMVTAEGPKLLEYNVRFGDPETQILIPDMVEPFVELCRRVAEGHVEPGWIEMRHRASVGVVLASPGYPERPTLGLPFAVPAAPGISMYHAGTRREGQGLVTAGGRVLSVVAHADSLETARHVAYEAIGAESPLQFRRDIGARP